MAKEKAPKADKEALTAVAEAKKAMMRTCQWWKAERDGREPHEVLSTLVGQIRDDQSERYQCYRIWAQAMGQDMTTFSGETGSIWDDQLTINELQNTVETLHAQVFKNKVVPSPCPSEADYDEFFRAMGFGRWIEGILDDCRVFYDVVPQVGLACLTFGTGCAKVLEKAEAGKIDIQAINPAFLFVDRLEARHGKPRSLHQKMHMDRWVALDKWGSTPEIQLSIIEAKQYDGDDFDLADLGDGDQITIWESWHLPSASGAKDGRHCIWMRGCTLLDEEWGEPTFPFVFMRFGTPMSGFWGLSAVQRLLPAQKAFDKLTQRIDLAHDLLGIPRIVKRPGAVNTAQIDDIPGTIIEMENPADMREWNPVPITPDAYRERDSLPQRMRGSIGVSGFEAQMQLPQQLREASGAAIERWVDAGNARHAMLHGSYEEFMMQLTYLIGRKAAAMEKDGVDVVVRAPGAMKSTVELLSFKKVKMDMDTLKLRVLPVSQLPRTFAGRVKELSQLKADGDITRKTYLRLLEIPDIESEIDALVSDEDIIRKNIDHMLRTGDYIEPLPYDNLDLIVKFAARKIHEVRVREGESGEDKVSLLIQYIEEALALKNGVGQPGPALGGPPNPSQAFAPPGAMPGGAPPPMGAVPPPGTPQLPPQPFTPPGPTGPAGQ